MRPQQQHNKRGRGRNRHRIGGGGGSSSNNGGGNPLTRVYDSNGPDVKVRGNAQTVAEKYLQLARDAQSSSDHVMAESYFQHAEHYLRIISEAQANLPQAQQQQFRRDEFDDEDSDEGQDGEEMAAAVSQPNGTGEQPDIQGEVPEFENAKAPQQQNFRQNRDNQNREGRNFRPRWQDRRDRAPNSNAEGREPVQQQPRPDEQPREALPAIAVAEDAPQWEAPSFLRRPAPMPAADEGSAPVETAVAERKPRTPRPRREKPAESEPAPEPASGE